MTEFGNMAVGYLNAGFDVALNWGEFICSTVPDRIISRAGAGLAAGRRFSDTNGDTYGDVQVGVRGSRHRGRDRAGRQSVLAERRGNGRRAQKDQSGQGGQSGPGGQSGQSHKGEKLRRHRPAPGAAT
ncbi:MAG: hypothetical protein EXQ82_04140 [Pseudolabrys sp.]|nr:hypothetical protein [Pseudolabrys sp.]